MMLVVVAKKITGEKCQHMVLSLAARLVLIIMFALMGQVCTKIKQLQGA